MSRNVNENIIFSNYFKSFFLDVEQCPTCQANMTINSTTGATNNPTTIAINNPNKRARFGLHPQGYDETDTITHLFQEKLELRHSKSEPVS